MNTTMSQPNRLGFEEFVEASTNAVLRAVEAQRADLSAGQTSLPTTTVGVIFQPRVTAGSDQTTFAASPAPASAALPQPDARLLAVAAGEIHASMVRRFRGDLAQAKGDRANTAMKSIDALHAKNLFTQDEVNQIKMLLMEIDGARVSDVTVTAGARRLCQSLTDKRASPLAIAIAGIAANCAVDDHQETRSLNEDPIVARGPKASGCVSEGLVGAILGAELGAGGGSVVLPIVGTVSGAVGGAILGGIVGCAAGALAAVL